MTTSSRKNYNLDALRGGTTDDMDVVQEFGLDPALAYTKEINAAAADVQMKRNIDAGKNPEEMKKKRDMIVRTCDKLCDVHRK